MSTTIDQRVVEMRFDNKHFENNVSTTMSTLDKLKQKLHLDGASKGLESINSAARNVKMDGLGTAVDNVRMRFSALEVMGVTALANITNSAVEAGKRIVSALTIDPIKTGLSEYETKINAIQVIQANTRAKYTPEEIASGKQMDDITSALDELNTYADKTIYNYAQMTSNIGKFVAQGLNVHEASKAVQGLANLAAASGASAEDMARATYQMSQALGGTIRLMDWNSLRNANMATVDLKNTLIDLAKVNGIAIDSMIEKHGTFEQTLSEGWLSGKMFSEAMNIYSGVYSEAELKAKGFTDAQVENFMALAKNAESAATEVKTFTQLWDVLKETAQSGWTQTWELIIGDFDAAKKTLTELQVYFSGIIDGWSDARNFIVEGVMNFSKPWASIVEKLEGTGLGKIAKVAETVGDLTDKLEYYQEVVRKVWRGEYNNVGDNPDRFDLLEKAGYDHRVIQDLVNKGVDYKLTVDDIEESHKKFGLTMKTATEETEKTTEAIATLTDKKLEDAGLTEDEIALYRALEKEADRLGISIDELVEKMSTTTGRTLLIDSIKNIWDSLSDVAGIAKKAWSDIFNPPTSGEIIVKLYGMLETLNEFTKKLSIVDDKTGELTETAKKFQRIFEGVFAAVDAVTTIVGGGFKIAFEVIKEILSRFDLDILEVAAMVGDAAVAFRDWLDSIIDVSAAVDIIIPFIEKAIEAIKNWANAIKDSEAFEVASNIVQGLIKGLANGADKVWDAAIEIAKNLLEKVKEVLGIHSPSTEFFEVGKNIIDGLINGIKDGASRLFEAIKGVVTKVVDWIKQLDFGAILAAGIGVTIAAAIYKVANVLEAFGGISESISGLIDNAGEVVKSFSKVLNSVAWKMKAEALKDFAIALGILVAAIITLAYVCGREEFHVWEAIGVIATLAAVLIGIAAATAAMGKASIAIDKSGAKISNLTSGLISIAAALLLVGLTVKLIGSMDPEEAKQGFLGLASVMGAIAVLMLSSKLFMSGDLAGNADKIGKTLFKISLAMLVMVATAKLIAGMSIGEMKKAAAGLTGLVVVVSLLMLATKMVGNNADKIGTTMIKLAVAMGALVIVAKLIAGMSWDEMGKAAVGMLGLVGVISALVLVTKLAGKDPAKIGGTILGIASAIMIMAIVVRMMSGMDEAAVAKGIVITALFGGLITGLIAATKLANKDAGNIGLTLLAIAGAIAILALSATLLGLVKIEHLAKGIVAVGLLSAMMSLMIIATRGASECKGNLIVMTVAIAVLAAAIAALSLIDTKKLLSTSAALAVLMGAFALMAKMSSNMNTSLKSLSSMVAVIVLLAAVLWGLSALDVDTSLETAAALSTLLLALSGSLMMLDKVKMGGGAWAAIGAIAVLGAVILELGFFLSLINKWDIGDAMPAVDALSVLIVVLTGVLAALTGLGAVISGTGFIAAGGLAIAIAALASLGLVVWELGAILNAMRDYNLGEAMPMVETLSALLLVMTGVLAALGVIGLLGGPALAGVIGMAALGLVVWELGAILNAMRDYNLGEAMPMVETLSALLPLLTSVLSELAKLGIFSAAALGGVVAMAALGLVVWELGAIINKLQEYELDQTMPTISVLSVLLYRLTDILGKLAVIGVFALSAIAGVAALTVMITAIGGLLIAIGALHTWIDGLDGILDKGIEVLNKIAFGLGSAVGNLIDGFMGAVGDGLVYLGEQLSAFADAIRPFLIIARTVDEDIIAGVGFLAAAILAFTVIELINGVANMLPIAGNLVSLGMQLSAFMYAIQPFIAGAAMVKPEMMDGIKAIAEAVLILTAADLLNGLASLITFGGNPLGDFASQLGLLGKGLNDFATNIGTFSPEQLSTVLCAAQAIKTLAKASAEIPNSGGLLSALVGENDLGTFASQFPILGSGLAAFVNNIGTFTDEQIATVNCAADAIKTLAGAALEIPNTGGLLASLVGENDLGVFAEQFPVLGSGLRGFLDNIGEFSDDQVETVKCAANAIKTLAEASNAIPNSGGLLAALVGENDLGVFAEQFPKVGTGLAGLLSELGEFTPEQQETVSCAANAIKTLAVAASAVPNAGGLLASIIGDNDLSSFASGLPEVGKGLKGFTDELGTFSSEKVATVQSAVSAINALANLSSLDLGGVAKDVDKFCGKLTTLASGIATFCDNMATVSTESIDTAVTNVGKLADMIRDLDGITYETSANFSTALNDLGRSGVDAFIEEFTGAATKAEVKDAAKKLVDEVIAGIESKLDAVKTAFGDLASNGASGIETQGNYDKFSKAGKWLGDGLISGINAKKTSVYWAAYALGQQAVQGEKDGQKSKSPSKLTIQAGKWLGEGLIIGIQKMGDSVYNAGAGLGKTATGTISSAIAKVADMVDNDIDAQPTIRPVLDLSDVESGVGTLGNMLGMGSSIGVSANVGAISSMMNARSQNGANHEVVSAIDKLRNDLGKVGNTSYHIDGVTYDDGSNVSEAIKTIIRYANIERRV